MLQSTSETYPLTTIDLCNLCAMPLGERYRVLRDWRKPVSWISYAATRNHWAKLVAREPSLDLKLGRDDKEALLAKIAKDCRYGEKDVAANLSVAEAVWDWALESDVKSVEHGFDPYRTPLATNHFFENGILVVGDKGLAVLLDPRRSTTNLNPNGRDFAFSAMHWKIAGIADYVDVEIAIMGITDSKTQRRVKIFSFSGSPVFSISEVLERIDETQRAFLDVQLERRDKSSRGTGK